MKVSSDLKDRIIDIYGKSNFAAKLVELDPDSIAEMKGRKGNYLTIPIPTIIDYLESGRSDQLLALAKKYEKIENLYQELSNEYNIQRLKEDTEREARARR